MPGPLLTWKGRRIRSPGDGPEAAARKVPAAPLRPGSLFFVPSPLEGWGVDTLLSRLGPGSAVVVFEKDADLVTACQEAWEAHLGPLLNDARLFVLEEDSEAAVQALFRRLPLATLRRCEFLPLNGAWLGHGPRYREVFQRLDQGLVRWWSNRMTCLHMGPLWVKNLFDNLQAPGMAFEPWPHWGTDTVLVCGAGVSLESALPWAADHRDDLRIVAADTALPALKAWGLVPDAVVCLEAQHANLRDFAGWTGADVMLFTDLTSFPPGSRVFGPPPRWFITEFAELNLWNRWPWPVDLVPRIPPLGSVGVAAAWTAWHLTEGRVILAGLDFSFPPGKSHARGAPALADLCSRTDRFHPMEQPGLWERPGLRFKEGGAWLTTPVMEGYAGVMADQARAEAHRTWVWDTRGLNLGLPVWDRSPPQRRSVGPSPVSSTTADPPPYGWVATETELWLTILEDFVRMNEDPTDGGAWADLETHLSMADYLTFHFPDPEFRKDSDWLIRAQVQVRWILDRVAGRR